MRTENPPRIIIFIRKQNQKTMTTNALENTKDRSQPHQGGQNLVRPQASGSSQINIGQDERIASAAIGAALTLLALRGGRFWLALSGGYLLYRGLSGNCRLNSLINRNTAEPGQATKALTVTDTVIVNKPKEEVYNYWRKLENLPRFMHHLETVEQLDARRSHWKAKVPGGLVSIAWDAEIVQEEANQRIAWRSVAGADVDNSGEVVFTDAPNNQGTQVKSTIIYRPPAGALGLAVSKLFNPAFEKMVKEDLLRFKSVLEASDTSQKPATQSRSYAGHN